MFVVELLIEVVILWIDFQLSFEVISILLLLFGEISKEVGIVLSPSFSPLFEHSLFTSFVVIRISHGPSFVFLDLVEDSIELHDGLLDLIPTFIEISSECMFWSVRNSLHLLVNNLVSLLHGVSFLVNLLELFHFIGWINHNTIGFIIVDVDINVGSWEGLHLSLWSVTKERGQVSGHIFLSDLEMSDGGEHGGIVIIEFRSLILQSNNFETLTADVAPVDWALSNKVEHLFVRVGIIFNTWSHANDNSP